MAFKGLVMTSIAVLVVGGIPTRTEAGQIPLDESGAKGRITFVLTTCFGGPISGVSLRLRSTQTHDGPDYRVQGDEIYLPYGSYEVIADAPHFLEARERFILDEPALAIAICLDTEGPEGLAMPMRTEVLVPPTDRLSKCMTALLSPVFRSSSGAPKLYRVMNGRFVVENARTGTYFVALLDGGKVCSTHSIDLQAGRGRTVRLR